MTCITGYKMDIETAKKTQQAVVDNVTKWKKE